MALKWSVTPWDCDLIQTLELLLPFLPSGQQAVGCDWVIPPKIVLPQILDQHFGSGSKWN